MIFDPGALPASFFEVGSLGPPVTHTLSEIYVAGISGSNTRSVRQRERLRSNGVLFPNPHA